MQQSSSDLKVIGIVFDVSLRHAPDGRRVIDHVKKGFGEFIKSVCEDDDVMYLYHPEIVDTVNRVGAQLAAISNYESDGWQFDLGLALKQTLFVLAAEPYWNRTLFFVTDRLACVDPVKKLLSLNERGQFGCRVVCVGIGDSYEKTIEDLPAVHVHVPDVTLLAHQLKELNEKQDIQSISGVDTE